MTDLGPSLRPGRRRRAASLAGQAVGVAGVIASVVLVIGIVVGRGWLLGQVDSLVAGVDGGLVRSAELVDTAQARLAEVGAAAGASTATGHVADGLEQVATRLAGLRGQVSGAAASIGTVVTLVAAGLAVGLVYVAFLHVVLFRAARGLSGRPPRGPDAVPVAG